MKDELKEQFSKAVKLKERGEYESAKIILLELETQDPLSVVILAVLGDLYLDSGALEEAANVFKRAAHLVPTSETVSKGVFHSLWKLGRRVEALEEAKRFLSLSDSEDYREIVKEINDKW